MSYKANKESLIELAKWFWCIENFNKSKKLYINNKLSGIALYIYDSTTKIYVYNTVSLDDSCIRWILKDIWYYNIYTVDTNLAFSLAEIGHDYQYDGNVYIIKRNSLGCLLK